MKIEKNLLLVEALVKVHGVLASNRLQLLLALLIGSLPLQRTLHTQGVREGKKGTTNTKATRAQKMKKKRNRNSDTASVCQEVAKRYKKQHQQHE
jgi:hypothetical protein